MTQALRQKNLLQGQDWTSIYRAFTTVNFSASDFDTYREAFIEYLRINYPEDFDDWIENSEFVMLMDLIAYLGENLAFKHDLNTRDNFIDVAERRESILNLAEMLSYSPSRNLPARGLAKIVEITTDEDVRDSKNNTLQNVAINWDDETNEDWLEQWMTILNAALLASNPFGVPVKSGTISDVSTALYQLNSVAFTNIVYPFSATVNGSSLNFEVVNPDFTDGETYTERDPDPENSMHLIYRNDNGGNSSIDTGFFFYFKQGTLQSEDFDFSLPIENRVTSIEVDNVNGFDVWAQEVNELTGSVREQWTKVGDTENVYYNSVSKAVRTIFAVQTKDNDQVDIRWPDGRFGDVPFGIFRLWYRTSNGLTYQINAQDIRQKLITIPYTGANGEEFNLSVRFSLEYPVTNSTSRETTEQVRTRAPLAYYTQNRMVNGEDYQTYPLLAGNLIRKSKSVNRTYAGHSRFIDVNDPTGHHQNTNVFSDDGILYRGVYTTTAEEQLPTTKSNDEIISAHIDPALLRKDLINFYYKNYTQYDWKVSATRVKWERATSQTYSSTGKFVDSTLSDTPIPIGTGATGNAVFVRPGALLRFVNSPTAVQGDPGYEEVWAKVETVSGTGITDLTSGAGPVTLNEAVTDGWYVDIFYTSFRTVLNTAEVTAIIDEMENFNSMALRYDFEADEWKLILEDDIDHTSDWSLDNAGDVSLTNKDASWLVKMDYTSSKWTFTFRYLEYVWESLEDVRFYLTNEHKTTDIDTGLQVRDYIKMLKINEDAAGTGILGQDYIWSMTEGITYDDGYLEPRRVRLTMTDTDDDGVPDNPLMFEEIVEPISPISGSTPTDHRFVFWQKDYSTDGYEFYRPLVTDGTFTFTVVQEEADIVTTESVAGDVFYAIDEDSFKVWDGATLNDPAESDDYFWREGRNNFMFQWKHFANARSRIDPAPSNIMDNYVLTEEYYSDIQTWLNTTGSTLDSFPQEPTTEDLRIAFADIETVKSASDSIVWHPAKFKILFGETADQSLRATFKVIKVNGVTESDNEVKQKVLDSINLFFDTDNWDFGETFQFSELAAYIHQSHPSLIASVVLVPTSSSSKFGTNFQVRSENNELFLSTAKIGDISVISNNTVTNLNIGS